LHKFCSNTPNSTSSSCPVKNRYVSSTITSDCFRLKNESDACQLRSRSESYGWLWASAVARSACERSGSAQLFRDVEGFSFLTAGDTAQWSMPLIKGADEASMPKAFALKTWLGSTRLLIATNLSYFSFES